MFKFVNVNKLVLNYTLKSSLAISSQTVYSKLHKKVRRDKQELNTDVEDVKHPVTQTHDKL